MNNRDDLSMTRLANKSIAEAMMMLELSNAAVEKFGGDTVDDLKAAYCRYLARLATNRLSD